MTEEAQAYWVVVADRETGDSHTVLFEGEDTLDKAMYCAAEHNEENRLFSCVIVKV